MAPLVLKQAVHFEQDGTQSFPAGTPKDEIPEKFKETLSGDHLWVESDEVPPTPEPGLNVDVPALQAENRRLQERVGTLETTVRDLEARDPESGSGVELSALQEENANLRSQLEQQATQPPSDSSTEDIQRLASFLEVEPERAVDVALSVLSAPTRADETETPSTVDYDELKLDQLKVLAAEREVNIEGVTKKAEIAAALRAADEKGTQEAIQQQ